MLFLEPFVKIAFITDDGKTISQQAYAAGNLVDHVEKLY